MKLTTVLRKFKQQLQNTLPNNDFITRLVLSLALVGLVCGLIWSYGPSLSYRGFAPLASEEKRMYTILFCILAWILKFLIVDLAFPKTLRYKTPKARERLAKLIKLFQGATDFMKKTSIKRNGNDVKLQDLPWVLFIGPHSAGKSALLAHSNIPFVLKRQFPSGKPENFEASENPDWWITPDATIVDVPSRILFHETHDDNKQENIEKSLWQLFLTLIKRQKRKSVSGIMIALPLPEIIKQYDNKQFDQMIKTLVNRIKEIQALVNKKLPCHIVITKTDLLPGFNEFFSEAPDDEINQAWGVTIPTPQHNETPDQVFAKHFNQLVKKLNQQLLWRLHHERNPMARPYIKDFPLQIERLKEFTVELIKQLHTNNTNCQFKGVYITSAQQIPPEQQEAPAHEEQAKTTERALQLFKAPAGKSRAYFIKQFLLQTLHNRPLPVYKPEKITPWKRISAYAASVLIIVGVGYVLGRDFRTGIKQTYEIKSNLAGYRQVLQEFHNPDQNMLKTMALLDALERTFKPVHDQNKLKKILFFYSNKSQENATKVYNHALQVFLLPEIRNYFADYLNTPVNKNADSIYGVLKAYIMLGNKNKLDPDYIREVLVGILPKSFKQKDKLLRHFDLAMQNDPQPLQLDNKLVKDTRHYLTALPSAKLGYIILKTLNNNSSDEDVALDIGAQADVIFSNASSKHNIPSMYTGKKFRSIISTQIHLAAKQAATGNWILGHDSLNTQNEELTAKIAEDIKAQYIKQYVRIWEKLISNVKMIDPKDLAQADAMIVSLTSYDSPLLQVLHVVYENTYFDPIIESSQKLDTIGQLINNTSSSNELYEILSDLQSLHEYLQPVIGAENQTEAAYKLLSKRMKHDGDPDPITKLRLAADKTPKPIKTWINQLTNQTWHYLLHNSMRYLNTSWNERVMTPYQREIANRYPFAKDSEDEVSLKRFIHFFGRPGIVTSFYKRYLDNFIDTSKSEWQWKTIGSDTLPFSKTVLRQIQQAMAIHHAFFPNDDDQLYVPFSLQKDKISKSIKSVKLNINDKVIVDENTSEKSPHVLKWPHKLNSKLSSIVLTMDNKKQITNTYPGTWGWFKLVSQAYESSKSNKEIIVNFSKSKQDAKYILSTKTSVNPFIALNLQHFKLENELATVS